MYVLRGKSFKKTETIHSETHSAEEPGEETLTSSSIEQQHIGKFVSGASQVIIGRRD